MQLVHVGGGDPFKIACDRALQWAWRVDGDPPDLIGESNGHLASTDGAHGVSVSWSSMVAESARAVELGLQHPDEGDPTLRWNSNISITDIQNSTRATLRLGLAATVHSLRPSPISLRPPGVVSQLMQAPLHAYAGSLDLVAGYKLVSAADVPVFVEEQLKAEDRALPILVVASEVHPALLSGLGRALAGLAQVVHVHDPEGDGSLGDRLAESGFTVPRGGLRLFWPGFGSHGPALRHPYWTAAQLRQGRRKDARSVVDQLVALLAPISTARVPADGGVLKVRRQWLQERLEAQRAREEATKQRARRQREDAQRVRREARKLLTGRRKRDGEVSDLKARLALIDGERKTAEGRARESEEKELEAVEEAVAYSDRVEALEAENADLRRSIRQMNRYEGLAGNEDGEADDIPEALDSWSEVAEHLDDLEGPGFCLTAQARECANGKGRYPRPDSMWRSLRALERVGRAFNEMGADLGINFEQFAFEQAGLKIALQDDTYSDCWFQYEGAWYERRPHVKVDDAKSPNEVGRIYFALDSTGRRVIVDWFGTKPDRPNTKRMPDSAAA